MAKDQAAGRHPIYSSAPISPLTDLASLRRNTLDFIACLRGDLGIEFDPTSGGGVICGDINDGAIKRTFDRLPFFFPHTANYARVYQDIAASETSGMYWGDRDVNSIANYLARYALYTPHIIVANPFCDRMLYHLDASPIEHPAMWRQVVANRAMFLVSIEPWIREGLVTVLPTLKWADWKLHDAEMKPRAEKRLDLFTPEQERALMGRSFIDLIVSMHPRDVGKFVRGYLPDAPPEVVEDFVRLAHLEMKQNPARYAWLGNNEDQLFDSGPGNNLESAAYQAALCKSYFLLGEKEYRDEFEFSLQQSTTDLPDDALTQMSKAFGSLTFSFLNSVKLDFVLGLRKDNQLASMREFLHRTWKSATTVDGIERLNADAAFREALEAEYAKYKQDWKGIQKRLAAFAVAGAVGSAATVLSGQFMLSVAFGGWGALQLKELLEARSRRIASESLPLGIFLKLEKAAK